MTCVSFLSETFCWVARGAFLELAPLVYEENTPRRKRTHLVFPQGGTIHGVEHGGNVSVVFGGRQLAILHGGRYADDSIRSAGIVVDDSRGGESALDTTLTVSDWIWDVKMFVHMNVNADNGKDTADTLCVAVALANNACEVWVFQRLRTSEDLFSYKAIRHLRITGAARSITYSMCFFGWNQTENGSVSDLILASGTVSNEILVWTAVSADETKSLLQCTEVEQSTFKCVRRRDEHCLQGHLGVIHAARFDKTGELLASASDDRSVRLWQKTHDNGWELMWTGWSHKARVWNVAFSSLGVVSCGEDATAKIWCLEDGSVLSELRVHYCQSLWSIDVHDNLTLIGCNDGTAKLWDLDVSIVRKVNENSTEQAEQRGTTIVTWSVPDDRPARPLENISTESSTISESCTDTDKDPSSRKKKAKAKVVTQTICGMEFYTDQDDRRRLLVATRAGSLFSHCFGTNDWETHEDWCNKSLKVNAADGSCVAVHSRGRLVAVGTTRGDIVLVALGTHTKRRTYSARSYLSIKRLAWLNDITLLSFHIKGIVIVWKFPGVSSNIFLDEFDIEPQLILNTTTMAVPTCFAHRLSDDSLFIGDSRGNIALFPLDGSNDREGDEVTPSSLARRVHKKEYVNDIMCLSKDRVISVGNDGCLRHSLINACGELECILSVPLSPLPGPSHFFLGNDGAVAVAGYHGNLFLVLDVASGFELFCVETGGRQRTHCCFVDFKPSTSPRFPPSYGMAVCINRADGLNDIIVQCSLAKQCVLSGEKKLARWNVEYNNGPSLHGEPVFDCCLFASRPSTNYNVLLSGSEDCTARVSIVRDSNVVASTLLPTQSSCIRAVCSSRRSGDKTSLMVVCGGQMNVHFYALTDNNGDGGAKSDTATLDNMVIRFLGTGYYPFKPSIDHRINAVRSVPIEGDGSTSYIVVTGDSDGGVHLFKVSDKNAVQRTIKGQLLFALDRPVLSVESIVLGASSHLLVIVGTSDGSAAIWILSMLDFSCPVSPLATYEAHQVGTNSISAFVMDEGTDGAQIRVCSGGDDQSLATCTVGILFPRENHATSPSLRIVSFFRLDVASASALKGVKLCDANHVLSVGYSQRLALWRLSPGATTLELLSMTVVDVADVNSFCASLDNNVVAVGGMGIELVALDLSLRLASSGDTEQRQQKN